MDQRYTIKLPTEYKESPQKEDFEKELRDVQTHFDERVLQLEEGVITFVFLRGFYSQINRSTLVLGVFVSTLSDEILALSGKLGLRNVDDDNFSAETNILIQNESIDRLKTNEGVLVHLEIPTQGVSGNVVFEADEIEATFADVEYVKPSNEVSEIQQVDSEDSNAN